MALLVTVYVSNDSVETKDHEQFQPDIVQELYCSLYIDLLGVRTLNELSDGGWTLEAVVRHAFLNNAASTADPTCYSIQL